MGKGTATVVVLGRAVRGCSCKLARARVSRAHTPNTTRRTAYGREFGRGALEGGTGKSKCQRVHLRGAVNKVTVLTELPASRACACAQRRVSPSVLHAVALSRIIVPLRTDYTGRGPGGSAAVYAALVRRAAGAKRDVNAPGTRGNSKIVYGIFGTRYNRTRRARRRQTAGCGRRRARSADRGRVTEE